MSKNKQSTLLDMAGIADWRHIANRFIWNSALLMGMYYTNSDEMIWGRNDTDLSVSLKLAGVIEGLSIARPLLRQMVPFELF